MKMIGSAMPSSPPFATVVKQGPPADMALEAAKTEMAWRVSVETGLFRVPRVVAFDARTGRLELERVHGFAPIWGAVARFSVMNDLWSRLGRVVAVAHQMLDPAGLPRIEPPASWRRESSDHVVVHGDLSTANVQWNADTGEILLLDWSSSPLLGPCFTVAAPEFDLAWLISGWFTLPRRHARPRAVGRKAATLLEAYQRERGAKLDAACLSAWIRQAHGFHAGTRPRGLGTRWLNRRDATRLERFLTHELLL